MSTRTQWLWPLVMVSAIVAGCGVSRTRVTVERQDSSFTPEDMYGETLPERMPTRQQAELPELTKDSPLSEYLEYAALNNAGLREAFQEWKAALERVPQVTALPDPKFSLGYLIQEVETRVGPQEWRVGIKQTFPWFGKLDLKGNMAARAAKAAWQRFNAEKLHLFHRVKKAYAEYFYLSQAIKVTRRHRDLVKYLEEVARTQYKTGVVPHSAVIKAQVERGKLEDRLASLQDLKDARAAKLNSALGRRAGAALPWPVELSQRHVRVRSEKVLAQLRESNPKLRALRQEVERAESALDLAKLRYYPDITAGLSYMSTGSAVMSGLDESGKDPILATLSINIPLWWNAYRAGEREKVSHLRQARMALEDRSRELESEVELVVYSLQDARRKINLYGDSLVPQARQSMEATRASFKTGDADILALLDAERTLLQFRLERERAVADHLQNVAKLEMLVGKRMTGREEKAAKPGKKDGGTQGQGTRD